MDFDDDDIVRRYIPAGAKKKLGPVCAALHASSLSAALNICNLLPSLAGL